MDFVIGIACRNEGRNIYDCLQSIEYATRNDPQAHITKVLICINNTTDNTEEEVLKFSSQSRIKVSIFHSKGNLIDAQRTIWNNASGLPVVFIDADTRVEEGAFKKIIYHLKNPAFAVVYVSTKRIYKNTKKLVSKLHAMHTSGRYLSKQYYFHGRMFAIRDWYAPESLIVNTRAQESQSLYLLNYGGGLITDDIYLSTYILHKYGLSSIKKIESKEVKSVAIQSWKDWYKAHRRIVIEVKKIERWFPEWNYLNFTHYRKTDWKKWKSESSKDKWLWLLYPPIESFWNLLINAELVLVRLGVIQAPDQWKVIESTKQKINT